MARAKKPWRTPTLTRQVLLARPERRVRKVRQAWSGRQVRKVFKAIPERRVQMAQ